MNKRKFLSIFNLVVILMLLLYLTSYPIYADQTEEETEVHNVYIKHVFHLGWVEDGNEILVLTSQINNVTPGEEVSVDAISVGEFYYHIDNYPDEMTWMLGSREVLGGNDNDPLEIDDWGNFHTPSMIHEDIDIIFHYCPYRDLAYLDHYFEQEDGSYKIMKRQGTKLNIYNLYEQEYDLSNYYLKNLKKYEFDTSNENNILIGAPVLRTSTDNIFSFKFYYNLIKEEETTTEEVTTSEETTSEEETTTEEFTEEETTTTEEETTIIVEESTTEEITTMTEEETSSTEEVTTEEEIVPTLPPETTEPLTSEEETIIETTEETTSTTTTTEEETLAEEETTVVTTEEKEEQETSSSEEEKEKLPKMGDENSYWLYVLLISSLFFIILLIYNNKRRLR